MIAVDNTPKTGWMQIPSYAQNAISNNSHLPPPPTVNGIPASTGSMSDIKPYIGDDGVNVGQMTHMSRPNPHSNAGHTHGSNVSSGGKSSQERVKRPMNAFMVRIRDQINFLLLLWF